MSVPSFETERLRLRVPDPERDVDAVWGFLKDPDVMRYITGKGMQRSEVEAALKRSRIYFETTRMGGFVVERKSDGAIIGDCLLVPIPHRGVDPSDASQRGPETEIGYRFAKEAWGRGYATEAATRAMQYAFSPDGGDVETLLGVTDPANASSQRVLKKIGMNDVGLSDAYYDETLRLFSLSRQQFRQAHDIDEDNP